MISTSIICVKRDVESALEALNSFGEFHIEQATASESFADYNQSIQKVEESIVNVNHLMKQLITTKNTGGCRKLASLIRIDYPGNPEAEKRGRRPNSFSGNRAGKNLTAQPYSKHAENDRHDGR
jgi:hypothetical protein